jgi:hypothetical protein
MTRLLLAALALAVAVVCMVARASRAPAWTKRWPVGEPWRSR